MTWRTAAAAAVLGLALAGCDDVQRLLGEVQAKGGETDVPEAARESLDAAAEEALRQRIQGQNFN